MPRRFSELTGFVLVGGESRRMGRPKHELMLGGETLLERAVRVARSVAGTVAILGPADRACALGVPVFPDEVPGRGPLGALYTGLCHSRTRLNLFLSCDLPLMSPGLIAYLASQAIRWRAEVTVAETPGEGYQPLAAIYSRQALPAVRTSLVNGHNKMTSFYPRVRLRVVGWSELAQLGLRPSIFANLNTPEEYQAARRRLGFSQSPRAR